VINTVKPDLFQHEIQKALKERKEKQALSQNRFIEMNEEMLHLITHSQHISSGKQHFSNIGISYPRKNSQFVEHCQA